MNETDATDLVTALFDRWYMSLVRYALRTTQNYAVAEELAQDTFVQRQLLFRFDDSYFSLRTTSTAINC